MKIAAKIFSTLLFLLLALLIAQLVIFYYFPAGPGGPGVTFEVPAGAGSSAIAEQLREAGLIRSALNFKLLARLHARNKPLQRGEYELNRAMPPIHILRMLLAGKVKRYKFTAVEGYNMFQVAAELEKTGIAKAADFLALGRDKKWLNELQLPGATVEGFLFPETYFFSKNTSARQIQREMVEMFFKNLTSAMQLQMRRMNLDLLQLITLASIIEKETGAGGERKLISTVFHNRLKRGMRLQADPTVIYGLLPDFDGNLTKKHLETKTPYNTYRISGLPQGPIANPGKASIEAALDPARQKLLYFVSKNDGTHVFAKNLKEHNKNVAKYQLRSRRGR